MSPCADNSVGKSNAVNQIRYTLSGIGLNPNLRPSGLLVTLAGVPPLAESESSIFSLILK